ncbi:hypothetical protein [Aliivibrio wodanis]|uniref:hypothetical protein n=1 Tax=Aliivibrio wodanis TaxID=80852 RepID=UPI00406BEEB6
MNKSTVVGFLTSFLGLAGLIAALSHGSHFPIYQWPYEALQGIVFSFAFGLGFSVPLSYAVTLFILCLLLITFFMIGAKLARFLLGFK